MPSEPSLSQSAAATSARRLSQRATDELLRHVLARVAEDPSHVADILADFSDPLIAFTAARRVITANHAAEKFFGYGRRDLDGRSSDLLIPEAVRRPDAAPLQPIEALTTVELPGLRRDGSEPHLSWTFGAVSTTPPIFVAFLRDRAEIDDALEALYTSEQRFRLLVDGVRDHAMILLDDAGRVATWNRGAERILGWSAEEAIGKAFDEFYPPDERAGAAETLARSTREGHVVITGWRMRKDGSRIFAEVSIWPLFTQEGTLEGFAKITHDLTAKREAAEAQRRLELERAAREAAEAGRDRLARLHRAAQSLSRATTPEGSSPRCWRNASVRSTRAAAWSCACRPTARR
jgi:PAS domain S-box-containing protein